MNIYSSHLYYCFYLEGNKFYYKAGNTYSYQYVINGTTSILGASAKHSSLHISSTVHFKFISSCDVILAVSL